MKQRIPTDPKHVTFESHWLSLPAPWPQANYELENDDAFWSLTASLVNRTASADRTVVTALNWR